MNVIIHAECILSVHFLARSFLLSLGPLNRCKTVNPAQVGRGKMYDAPLFFSLVRSSRTICSPSPPLGKLFHLDFPLFLRSLRPCMKWQKWRREQPCRFEPDNAFRNDVSRRLIDFTFDVQGRNFTSFADGPAQRRSACGGKQNEDETILMQSLSIHVSMF